MPFSFKKFNRTVGSLKLAVIVLAALAGVLIFSTFYESKTSTAQVQQLVYQSWWFQLLLCTLGLNVFSAAMSRYPWKGYQTGFVITHLGIIILLIGSIIGLRFGVEGNITLVEKGAPRSSISQDFEVVQLVRKDTAESISLPLEHGKKTAAGEIRQLKAAPDGIRVGLRAHHPNTREELVVNEGGSNRNPALKFQFSSTLPGMEKSGMNVTEWLVENDPERNPVSVGPAVFRLESIDSESELQARLKPAEEKKDAGKGSLAIEVGGQKYAVPVEAHLEKEFKSPDGKLTVKLDKYYPDLRIVNKEPVSVSEDPNNPAIFFNMTTAEGSYRGFAFADYPEMNMVHSEKGPEAAAQVSYSYDRASRTKSGAGGGVLNTITLLVGPNDRLYFTSASAKSGFNSGELKKGEGMVVSPNSPMKPELKILDFQAKPLVTTRIVPAETNAMTRFSYPAVDLAVTAGQEKKDVFLRWGEPKTVQLQGRDYELTYGWSTVPLDFSVELKKFNIPKYEGTDMDAGYESYIRVRNAKTGEDFEQKVWMNNPLTYRGYRISQASFDRPENSGPYRSTLQVLNDPGWVLKLIGSLGIILGITTMFYIKPYFKGLKAERARRAAAGQNPADKGASRELARK